MALGVFLVAFGGVTGSVLRASSHKRAATERLLASGAALEIATELQGIPFDEVYARFNSDPADDPEGPGTARGGSFPVPGLSAAPNDEDGIVGEILFPGNGMTLSETAIDIDLGLPRDLNGDGDALDEALTDYTVLPVIVRVAWRGTAGTQNIEVVTTLNDL